MNDPSVTTNPPEREERPVAELERGQWVEVIDQDGDTVGEAKVLHVEAYADDLIGHRALLIYQCPGYNPDTLRCDPAMTLPLLTEDEVAVQVDNARRASLAAQFTALADLIGAPATPLPPVWRSITVEIDFTRDVEALAAFAKMLGGEVRDQGTFLSASREGSDDYGAGLYVMGRASKPQPEPAADLPGLTHMVTADSTWLLCKRPYGGIKPGEGTTDDPAHVTCPDCLAALKAAS